MRVLFDESKAAEQCLRYAIAHGLDVDELLDRCYQRIRDQRERAGINADDWWVALCFKDDKHKDVDVNGGFVWNSTPEGHDFWSGISRGRF